MPYEFLPVASDPDGDALTFSAANLPPWASFDASTGKISGTPRTGDAGQYEEISVTVADAAHSATITPFNIVVTNGDGGVARLQWERPGSHLDGSPLDDLAGYRIVYGHNADELDNSIFIEDASQTSYEFGTLDNGVWYFAIIGVSACGLEGPPTTVVMKSI